MWGASPLPRALWGLAPRPRLFRVRSLIWAPQKTPLNGPVSRARPPGCSSVGGWQCLSSLRPVGVGDTGWLGQAQPPPPEGAWRAEDPLLGPEEKLMLAAGLNPGSGGAGWQEHLWGPPVPWRSAPQEASSQPLQSSLCHQGGTGTFWTGQRPPSLAPGPRCWCFPGLGPRGWPLHVPSRQAPPPTPLP